MDAKEQLLRDFWLTNEVKIYKTERNSEPSSQAQHSLTQSHPRLSRYKDTDWIFSYPDYPAESHSPSSSPLSSTWEQLSQLETLAVHRSHEHQSQFLSQFVASNRFWADKSPCGLLCFVCSVHSSSKTLPGFHERDWFLISVLALSLSSCLSCAGYLYSFVLRKKVQIKFWDHQHFLGPTAAHCEGKHGNSISIRLILESWVEALEG